MGEKVVHATAGRNLSVKIPVHWNMSRSHTTRTFIWNFLRNPRRNASLIPSSRCASRAMFEGIDLSQQAHVVELGPGTGCFTRELYANVPETCNVIVIELNPITFRTCVRRMGTGLKSFKAVLRIWMRMWKNGVGRGLI